MTNSVNHDYLINLNDIRKAFNIASNDYDAFAVLQRTIAGRLIESFDYIKTEPTSILDLGSGTGYGARELKKRFKKARVYQCDLSDEMLKKSRQQSALFFSKDHFFCADASQMPLLDNCVDLVFSSLMLQWCYDLDAVFSEIKRVLKPEGVFLFASFGPDTLKELRDSWRKVDSYIHTNAFVDMHDIGDALVRNKLNSPVLSVEYIILTYDHCKQLMRELKRIGAGNINSGRRKTLTGKKRLVQMMNHYETYRQNNKLPATYEVIYGHAWNSHSDQRNAYDGHQQTVSLETLKKQLTSRSWS